jgi:hypothetical protein
LLVDEAKRHRLAVTVIATLARGSQVKRGATIAAAA